MKQCPLCHFTFEDHEQLCDFDGSALTVYPERRSEKLAPPQATVFKRLIKSRISLSVLALAGLLSSALLNGNYDSSSHAIGGDGVSNSAMTASVGPSNKPPASIASANTRPSNRGIRAVKVVPSNKPPTPIASANTRPSNHGIRAVKANRMVRLPTAPARVARVHPSSNSKSTQAIRIESAHPKKESKVTAILKKTGGFFKKTVSILKKPFEF